MTGRMAIVQPFDAVGLEPVIPFALQMMQSTTERRLWKVCLGMPSLSRVCLAGRCDGSTIRMISSFSQEGYLIPRLPQARTCFFKQPQFQRGHDLLSLACLPAKNSPRRRLPHAPCPRAGASFPPRGIPLTNCHTSSRQYLRGGNALRATQTFQNNADCIRRRMMLARRTADILDYMFGRRFLRPRISGPSSLPLID